MPFAPHDVTWTAEKVKRFWDSHSGDFAPEDYFSKAVGAELIEVARARGAVGGRVLDYGCGPGYLLDALLAQGVACEGLDVSPSSVEQVRARLGGQPKFRGAQAHAGLPTPLAGGAYDTIFFLETIEHVLDEDVAPTLAELKRLLAPGGRLIVSTPNEENLRANQLTCPDCGCRFHRVQHVRAYSKDSLRALLASHGFDVRSVETRTLRPPHPLNPIKRLARRLRGGKDLNLIAIAARPG